MDIKIDLNDLGKRFDIPYRNLWNWKKERKESWRNKLFNHLVKIYLREKLTEIDNQQEIK